MARRKTAETPAKTYAVAYPPGLNLREEPSKEAKILRVLKYREAVTPLDKAAPDGWMAVDGGYVMREFLE